MQPEAVIELNQRGEAGEAGAGTVVPVEAGANLRTIWPSTGPSTRSPRSTSAIGARR